VSDTIDVPMGKVEHVYAPKRPCPRDLGLWYCDDCNALQLEEQSYSDYPLDYHVYCAREFDGRVCGNTHLGFAWCDECQELGRKEHTHCGEFEVVGTISEDAA
jgi:hypothetical protein